MTVLLAAAATSFAAPIPTVGLAAWYNAGTLGLLNGSVVATWNDSSPNALDVTGNDGTTFVANAINGQPAVQFEPGGFLQRALVAGTVWGTTDSDVFFVMKQNGSNEQNTVFSWVSDGANRFLLHATWNNALVFQYGQDCCATNGIFGGQPSGWDDQYHVLEANRAGAGGGILVDNGAIPNAGGFSTALDTSQSATLFLGTDVFANNFSGQIAEILVYNRALDTEERQSVANYFYAKYDVSGVPEPATGMMLILASGVIAILRRKLA